MTSEPIHETFIGRALDQARRARDAGEVPIGAVLVSDGAVCAEAHNEPIRSLDPSAHAEILVLRRAAQALGNYRLPGTTLYVTIEPCLMCVGALVLARVATLVYGADDPKAGAIRSIQNIERLPLNHRFDVVGGVREHECRELMLEFFRARRERPDDVK